MKCFPAAAFFTMAILIAGCATPRNPNAVEAPQRAAEPVMQGRPAQTPTPAPETAARVPQPAPAPAGTAPAAKTSPVPAPPAAKPSVSTLPPGEYAVLIESDPAGATVVVNGIPIGKTPQRVILPGTARGFSRDQVSLKVRFIAPDATQSSQTVEELLTPLDRIPAAVRFTPDGTSRLARR